MTLAHAEVLASETPADLAGWLAEHHPSSGELWVRIYKEGSGQRSVTWTDCVVEAIRFGWIDGLKKAGDERSYLQRLTPRRPGSNWSARNRDHAERLIAEGRMTPAGLAHVEAARAGGRWDTAYEGSATMVIPQDFWTRWRPCRRQRRSFELSTAKTYIRSTTAFRRPSDRRPGLAECSRSSSSSRAVSASTDLRPTEISHMSHKPSSA
ncbi:YdeI/OmpD-associated family protein [Sphingomonas sp. DT-51]|uniref:YdeI/OmpD-associated family protein n=1 Tax=Sphingomonas sp. DT-51 TaxID=3396165 RepID=UPI003F54160B